MDNKNEINMGTLYDLNKEAMKTVKKMTKTDIEKVRPRLERWFNWQLDGYAMLLCRERYDFTVFHLYEKANPNPPKLAVNELFETLANRGQVLSIEKKNEATMENAWEIWVKIDKEPFVYYLFNCDDFVIQC